MIRPVAFVSLPAADLEAMIKRACAEAVVEASRRAAASVERLSAAEAARHARRRRSVVLSACASGALPAVRSGKAWSIRASDLDAWCSACCPVQPADRKVAP